jgi:putative flippase GtrA
MLAGAVTVIIEIISFQLFYTGIGLNHTQSHVVSFVLGIGSSFVLNKFWVFQARGRGSAKKQAVQVAMLGIINLGASTIVYATLTDGFGVQAIVAKVSVMALVALWNYLIFQRVVFHERK